MPEIEFDPVDTVAAGAVGVPGQRTFYIQATKDGQMVSVLVEKEQVAVLADRLQGLLDQVAEQFPDEEQPAEQSDIVDDPVPLFRAVAIGIGFDPARRMVLLELHERPVPDEDEEKDEEDGEEGYLARLYVTPGQARAMALRGSAVVEAGRPPCSLCGNPLDPEGHLCPKLNGQARPH